MPAIAGWLSACCILRQMSDNARTKNCVRTQRTVKVGKNYRKKAGIGTVNPRRYDNGRYHFFLAFFDSLKDSQTNTNWLAMKMDE